MRAKDDCNQLLNATVPFAERMLREYGEFLPFGAKMLSDGQIVSVGADDGEQQSRSQDLIDLLTASFRADAEEGTSIATALVYDVRVSLPGTTEKTDAIAVHLDHRDDYSIKVFFPYALADGEPLLKESFANVGDYAIFPAPNPLHA